MDYTSLYRSLKQSSPRLFADAQKITALIMKASSKSFTPEKTWTYLKRLEQMLGRKEGFQRPQEAVIQLFLMNKLTTSNERKAVIQYYKDVITAGKKSSEITDLLKEKSLYCLEFYD